MTCRISLRALGVGLAFFVGQNDAFSRVECDPQLAKPKSNLANQLDDLLHPKGTPLGAFAWDKMTPENLKILLSQALTKARRTLKAIENDKSPPTFENTILAYINGTLDLEQVWTFAFHLGAVKTSPKMKEVVEEISLAEQSFTDGARISRPFYQRIKKLYSNPNFTRPEPRENSNLKSYYDLMLKAGDTLPELERGEYRSYIETLIENLSEKEAFVPRSPDRLRVFFEDEAARLRLDEKIEAIIEHPDNRKRKTDEKILIRNYHGWMVDAGVNYEEEKQREFLEISERLVELSVDFEQNLLESQKELEITISDESALRGLPANLKALFSQNASERGLKDRWIIGAVGTSAKDSLKWLEDENTRFRVYEMLQKVGSVGQYDNTEISIEILKLRQKKALMMGYDHAAHINLNANDRPRVEEVVGFLKDTQSKTIEIADREATELLEFAREKLKDPSYVMTPWDEEYYAQALGKEKYGIDLQELEAYFGFESTLAGFLKLFEKLYQVKFEPVSVPVHHPDVRAYRVRDLVHGFDLGLVYYDPFSRAGKGIGSWAMSIKEQYFKDGVDQRPHIFLATDINKSVGGPSFFNLDNLLAFPHEVGHGVHGLFSQVRFQELSGMTVPQDFVEAPSSLMENFLYDPSVLKMIARHSETGEVIPDRLIEMIRKSRAFRAATYVERGDHGMRRALLDIALHTEDLSQVNTREDLIAFEDKILGVPHTAGRLVRAPHSNTFSYIYYGGYESNFNGYSRCWQISGAGYLEFENNGVINPTIGRRFRNSILSQGGVYQSLASFEELFIKRKIDNDAFLRARGIPVGGQ